MTKLCLRLDENMAAVNGLIVREFKVQSTFYKVHSLSCRLPKGKLNKRIMKANFILDILD